MERTTHRTDRAGFTLLELLTVIVIIGILAAILVPVLNRSKDRAHELSAKELCSQTVSAWNQLVLNHGRLPSAALLKKWSSEARESGGDLVVAMSPGALGVLNWWTPQSLVPAGDVNKFKPKAIIGNSSEDLTESGLNASPDLDIVEFYPADQLLECNFVQKCVGLYPPWAEREFKSAIDAALSPDEEQDSLTANAGSLESLRTKWGKSMVRVVLDMDGDGILILPEDIAALAAIAADETDQKAKLRGTAAAWTFSKDGKRLLTSW
jgi:prepilin-type N-terminal cleavage/methylation domain-containing protein